MLVDRGAVFVVVVLLVLYGFLGFTDAALPIGVCITNCVQCKKMFGKYFQGRACGDACVLSNGKIDLDCNNPDTFVTFLKRFY